MGDSEGISREDIPDITVIKTVVLQALESGRQRSLESCEHEAAKRLGLSKGQRAYRISGSATTLFSNRFEKARSELHREGLIEYPSRGKVRLTETSKVPVASLSSGVSTPSSVDEMKSDEHTVDRDMSSAKKDKAVDPLGVSPEPYQPRAFEGGIVAFPTEQPSARKSGSKLPLSLALIGILLCVTGVFAFAGIICGIAALVLHLRDKRQSSGERSLVAPKTTLALGACSVVLGILIVAGGFAAGDNQTSVQQPPDVQDSQQEFKPTEVVEEHELSFVVEGDGTDGLPSSVGVLVSGKQSDGTAVSDTYEAAIGKTYVLAYPAGSYAFEIDSASLNTGDLILSVGHFSYSFTGAEDHTVHIKVSQDAKAMQEKQAAQEEIARIKAEEEAAAAAVAAEQEAAAAAEREAAAAAAAEQEAAAAAAASGGSGGGDTVYITNTGEKYHSGGCRYLKKSKIPIDRSSAIAQGYGACSVCNP